MSKDNNICDICGKPQMPHDKIESTYSDTRPICAGHPKPALRHDGDLGHNASVCYWDEEYIDSDGERFFNEEVSISDKRRHVVLVPKEALSLLAWLKQEEAALQRLAKEQEG